MLVCVLCISRLRKDHGKVLAMTLIYVRVCSDVNRVETVDATAQTRCWELENHRIQHNRLNRHQYNLIMCLMYLQTLLKL